jgi:formylglycine-generating enzyme required for sulfatase activity
MYNPNDIFANRYLLLEKIGIGGFSEVWKANDQMAEDATVAIKIYAPERGMDEHGLKQFRREYAVVLNLNHPNLLTARHFDVIEGRPYLVMPYIQGGSLYGKLMEQGHFTEEEIAKMLVQIASGLEYLHKKDVLHQDIKPDNILIDSDGSFLLTDFGISSRLRSTLRKSTTSAKSLTVAYAPPERFAKDPETLDSSDIFSLGVLVYELAVGEVPWMGSGGVSLTIGAEVPRLPEVFSNRFNNLIAVMMSLRTEDRPTASEVLSYARHFVTEGTWPEIRKPVRPAEDAPKQPRGGRQTQRMDEINMPPAGGYSGSDQDKASDALAGNRTIMGSATDFAGGGSGGGPQTPQGGGYSGGGAQTPQGGGIYTGGNPPTSNSSKMPLIIGIIILLVALGAGGWFYMENQKNIQGERARAEQNYRDAIRQADTLFDAANYAEALPLYIAASAQRQEVDPHVTSRIDESRRKIAESDSIRIAQAQAQALQDERERNANLSAQQERDRVAEERRQEQARFNALPVPVQALINNMVSIPGGSIQLGCTNESAGSCDDDEKPVKNITLSGFQLNKFEVTHAQWRAIMGTNATTFTNCDNCAVDGVSYNSVQDFLRRLNDLTGRRFRLPTEAEWEFAARGGRNSRNMYFSGGNTAADVAWFLDNSEKEMNPVGRKRANELGLHDMSGNAWEFTSDYFDSGYYNTRPTSNPRGPASGTHRVIRGGGYLSEASDLRVSYRFIVTEEAITREVGFRVAANN